MSLEIERNRQVPKPDRKRDQPFRREPNFDKLFPQTSQFDFSSSFHRGSSRPGVGYKLALWSALASFIDFLVVVSMVCFFIVLFSLMTNSTFQTVLVFLQASLFQFSMGSLFFISLTYMIFLRSLLGYSIGDWACGLRLGTPKERLLKFYSLRVCLRTLIVFASGIVVLPILSLIFGRDLAGLISGLPLMSLRNEK